MSGSTLIVLGLTLGALGGALGLVGGYLVLHGTDVRKKEVAREDVATKLKDLSADIQSFVDARRTSQSSAKTNESFETQFWGRVVGLRDAVQREYQQSDERLNDSPGNLDRMGAVAAGLSELADRLRAGHP